MTLGCFETSVTIVAGWWFRERRRPGPLRLTVLGPSGPFRFRPDDNHNVHKKRGVNQPIPTYLTCATLAHTESRGIAKNFLAASSRVHTVGIRKNHSREIIDRVPGTGLTADCRAAGKSGRGDNFIAPTTDY